MNGNRIGRLAMPGNLKAGTIGLGGVLLAAGLLYAVPSAGQQYAQAQAAQAAADDMSPATIRRLQHSLMQGGYAVSAADGVWGPGTAAAVREFQKVKGLPATGRPDAKTLTALGVTEGGPMQPGMGPAAAGETGKLPPVRARTPADLDKSTVRAIQQALQQQGFQVGAVDGAWGDQTVTAIGNFQRARNMAASGVLDAPTLAGLGLLPGGAQAVGDRSGKPPAAAQLDPALIRMIQQSLTQRGFKVGAADGMWGDQTVNALRDFQRTQGIEPMGEPDVYTLAALGLLPGNR